MTSEFFAEARAEWQGLLARPVRMIDLEAEPLRARQVAPVAPVAVAPVATPAAPVQAAQPVPVAAAGPADGPSFRTLAARFPGSCRRCGFKIAVGQSIRYAKVNGKGVTYHLSADCPAAQAAAQPVVTVAPVAPVAAPVLAPQATSPLAFAMAGAQKPRRKRQAAPRAPIAPAVAVPVADADPWF